MAANAYDTVTKVPNSRWAPVSGEPNIEERCQYAAFMLDVECFDNHVFSISVTEASAMDPQQRLLLEHSYALTHAVGLGRQQLLGSGMGVYVGITSTEFGQVPIPASVYGIGGVGHCFAVGRISYVLGLQGPCVATDTACSSSLVAGHSAMRAVQRDESQSAVLAGVHSMLLPSVSHLYAAGGLTSKRGRSHTFDSRADGFGRGEACGSALLGTEECIGCVQLTGAAVRQDGKSASLTAPNGQAQQALLRAARADAFETLLSYLEAHGTGTALGDPIEAGAFAVAGCSSSANDLAYLSIGGAKANVGHTEPAAGMAGMLKLVYGLNHVRSAPNAQLRVLNPHVIQRLGSIACDLPTQLSRLQAIRSSQAAGGVSSFGLGGTIAHAVLAFGSGGDREALAFGRDPDASEALAFGALGAEAATPFHRRLAFPWSLSLYFTSSFAANRTCHYSTFWSPSSLQSHLAAFSFIAVLVSRVQPAISFSLPLPPVGAFALLLAANASSACSTRGVLQSLLLTQQLLCTPHALPTFTFTAGTQTCTALTCGLQVTSGASHGATWGFTRVLRQEHADLPSVHIDVNTAWQNHRQLLQLVAQRHDPGKDCELVLGRMVFASQLRRLPETHVAHACLPGGFMLSGGLGGLGLRACALLSGMGASRLLLSSRSGHVARKRSDSEILDQQLIDLCSSKAEIAAHACDVADAQDAHRLGSHTTQCLGYFHAASSSGNALMNSPRVLPLFQAHLTGPKALGAYHLASCTQQQCFHTVLLFSSLAALGLSVAYQGTSLYASANAYLDSFAQTSRASARPSLSLRMANVGGQGMGSVIPDKFASLPGLVRISLDEFDRSIAQAVLWVCQPFATFNVLPSASYKLVHEFEGWATVIVDDEVEAMRVLEGPVQLKRSSSVCSRLSAAHAALVALDAVAAGTSLRLHTVNDVVIVGGGMTGLIVASELVRVGCSPIVLERQWTVGGVWRTHGNPHSRVNSTEPAYRMRVERTSSNADHSYFHEIIDDIRRLAAQLPQEFLALGAAVHAVFRHPSIGNLCAHGFQKIDASSAAPAEFLTVASAMLLLCTNRRLGPPRRVNYQGETNFGGIIKRGLGGDIVSLPWAGAQVIIIGHGPFAIEQARTALEHHAAGVLLAVRRHGLISPAVLDYLNIVRPFTDKFEHPTSGSGLMLRLWRDAYAVVRASPPETWEHGIFRPDGHSVSVSDIYFIAHHHYLITTRRASVLCFSDKNVTLDDGTVHLAHIVLKCLGFEINEGNERLVGRACMLPNGVVEQGLWTIVEPHLDAKTNLLPLVGHVSSINFTAKLVAALWNGQRYSTHGFAVLPRYTESLVVRINHVTASAANQHMLSQLASDEGLRDQLTQHVEAVAQDCHASWRPEEYLAVNREQWATLNTFLASLSRRGAKCLPYQFENALEVLKLELPHVLMEASRESMPLMNDEGVKRLSTSRVNGNNPEPPQIQMQHEFETMVKATVQDLAAGVITVDADMPLMEGALDSLAAAELSSRLQRLVGSATQVSSTVLFEYPNTRLLTRHLQSMVGAGDGLTRSALALATNVQAAAAVERALVLALSVMWGGDGMIKAIDCR